MGEAPQVRPVAGSEGGPAEGTLRSWILPAALGAVAVIVVLDWLTPAGIVVGILLSLPILATSFTDDPWIPTVTAGAAVIGFLFAAAFGRGPISPAVVWAPNRVFAFLTLPGCLVLARLIQRARLRTAAERERAERASDLNRLLLSLLAHDMRAPLGMAVQALDYLRSSAATGSPADPSLLSDVDGRLRRGLGAIDKILAVARAEAGAEASRAEPRRTGAEILSELEAEVRSFEAEAGARGKSLEVDLEGAPDVEFAVDVLLARQALAILVDNALRHAVPGPVWVAGGISGGELKIVVADEGPHAAAGGGSPESAEAGSRLGLLLCRTLVERAGGDLTVIRDEGIGTKVLLRLPLTEA